MTCPHFREFMKEQIELMKRHVDRHKFYRGIPDRTQAEEREIYLKKQNQKPRSISVRNKAHGEKI